MALFPVWFQLACAVILFTILPITDADELFVKPLEAENCSSYLPCLTLNKYASDADRYIVDNTTMTFMSGSHHLNIPLHQEELSNVTLRAMDEVVAIRLNFSSPQSIPNIAWINCYNITISGLNFDITGLSSEDGEFSILEFDDTSPIFLSDLTLHGSGRWRAIMLRNVDQASISSLIIVGATSSSGSAVHATESSIDFYGFNNFTSNFANKGGAIALYSCFSNFFEDFSFSRNSADYGGAMYILGGSLNMSGSLNFRANNAHDGGAMIIVNFISDFSLSGRVFFISNTASAYGGALTFSAQAPSNHAIITGMVSFFNNTAINGGAIFIHIVKNLSISGNVSFVSNRAISVGSESGFGGAVDVFIGSVSFSGEVVFMNNSASSGGAITLRNGKCNLSDSILFESNTAIEEGGAVSLHHPNVRLISFKRSQLHMTGTVTFLTNSAKQGGAIAFEENTKLMLNKHLQTDFIRNRADIYGGAIFVGSDTTSRHLCFGRPPLSSIDEECFFELDSSFHIQLKFSYNLAGRAGAAVFGGNLEGCKVNIGGSVPEDPLFILKESAISEIIPGSDNNMTSDISSEPLRVYICDNASQFMDSHAIEIVRGREIALYVNIVGQGDGTIPSFVRISLSNDVSIDAALRIQETKKECTRAYYRLKSKNDATTFKLFPDEGPCRGIGISSASVNVTFLPCPDGFKLEGPECTCEDRLRIPEYGVTCHVDNSTIFRRYNTFWMGTVYFDNNTYKGLILHSGCPIDYCTSSPVNITLDNLDVQCAHNHMGLLCGSCIDNHSIAFGGLHCLRCSNSYLALILPFALAGIVLVIAILLLQFSNGTINGLIFYANVVQANRSIFIPLGHTNVLTVFIAWLNLDLGIETCFYDGMNTYVFTWLQFVFPFYIWILIVIIIVMSHYSRRVSKIFGTNPVAALATLLLLSYSKILRAVIFALSYTSLEYPDSIRLVWRYDGTVPYFQRADHIILGAFSILVLLFLFVPYTLLLLCGHWLQKCSHWKFLSWINKIMPFLDAYYGPFKKEARYWTGLLLVVRCAFFLTFSLTSDGGNEDSKINLLAVSSITVCLTTLAWLHRGLYERLYNDILEGSFILNLCILAVVTYHVDGDMMQEAAVAYTSISVAFVTFLSIVLYHACITLRDTSVWKKFVKKVKLFHNPNAHDRSNQQVCAPENCDSKVRGPTMTFLELRESLLDVATPPPNNQS